MKDSYLNKERKHNADFMREKGYGDVLSMRKSIGRKGKSEYEHKKKELAGKKMHAKENRQLKSMGLSRKDIPF